ncbi:MAG: hypothetical protein ACLSFT_03245 [Ruminococcus callidus]
MGDDLSMDGQVVSGDVQNVTPSDDQMIAKVLVKEGDHVTKGTPLLDYDMTAVGLEVARNRRHWRWHRKMCGRLRKSWNV